MAGGRCPHCAAGRPHMDSQYRKCLEESAPALDPLAPPLPMVASLPKNHGDSVPPSFVTQCKNVVGRFREFVEADSGATDVDRRAPLTVEAFTWFMMDPNVVACAPATKDQLVATYKLWMRRNLSGAPPEQEVEAHLKLFFDWVEREKIAAIRL